MPRFIRHPASNKLVAGYVILALLHLAAIALSQEEIVRCTKPLLIPVLIILTGIHYCYDRALRPVLWALFFSFLGDTLLIFAGPDSANAFLFFIAGLLSFLVAHVFYIRYFLPRSDRRIRWTPIAIIAVYMLLFLALLIPHLGELLVPVIFYALVIAVMSISAFHLRNNAFAYNKQWIVVGAVLFMLSDSILGLGRFYPMDWNNTAMDLGIMTTYLAAQLCLVLGIMIRKI